MGGIKIGWFHFLNAPISAESRISWSEPSTVFLPVRAIVVTVQFSVGVEDDKKFGEDATEVVARVLSESDG